MLIISTVPQPLDHAADYFLILMLKSSFCRNQLREKGKEIMQCSNSAEMHWSSSTSQDLIAGFNI